MKKQGYLVGLLALTGLAPGVAVAQAPGGSSLDFITRMNTYDSWKMNNRMFAYGSDHEDSPTIQRSMRRAVTQNKPKASANGSKGAGAATPSDSAFASAVKATNFKFKTPFLMPKQLAHAMVHGAKSKNEAKDEAKAAKLFEFCLQSSRADLS